MHLEYIPHWAWVAFRWVALIALLLPFIPGLLEIFRRKDVKPLHIDQNFVKDPFFFSKAFVSKLTAAMPPLKSGKHTITMNKLEDLEITGGERSVESGLTLDHIVYSAGSFKTDADVKFSKEIYVRGNADIGRDNVLRAIAADGNIRLGPRTIVVRWIGSKGSIVGPQHGFLGLNAVAEESIVLPQGCVFRSMFAKPIITVRGKADVTAKGPERYDAKFLLELIKPKLDARSAFETLGKKRVTIGDGMEVSGGFHTKYGLEIGVGCYVEGNLVVGEKIRIRRDATIRGDVSARGGIHIGPNVKITGRVFSLGHVYIDEGATIGGTDRSDVVSRKSLHISDGCRIDGGVKAGEQAYISPKTEILGGIFSERDVVVKENCQVGGNIFGQGSVYIERGCTIGADGGTKSVIAKKGLYLKPNVIIYGQAATEGDGAVI